MTAPRLTEQIEACTDLSLMVDEIAPSYCDALRAAASTLRSLAEPPSDGRAYVKVNTGQPIKCPVQPDGHCYNPEVYTATGACAIHGSMPVQHPPATVPPSDGLVAALETWIHDCDADGGIAEAGCDQLRTVLQRARDRIVTDAAQRDLTKRGMKLAQESAQGRIAALEQQLAAAQADSTRIEALWRFRPADVGFWRVAYENIDDFRASIDRWIVKHANTFGDAAQSRESGG